MRGGRRRERAGHGPRRRARQCGGAGSGPRLDVRDAEPAPSHPPRSDPFRGSRGPGAGRQRPGGLDENRDRIRDEPCAEHRRRASARGRSFSSPGTSLRCAASPTEPPSKIRRHRSARTGGAVPGRSGPRRPHEALRNRRNGNTTRPTGRSVGPGRRSRAERGPPGANPFPGPGESWSVRTAFRSPTPAAERPAHQIALGRSCDQGLTTRSTATETASRLRKHA